MDLFRFIDSKDIREHLRQIGYSFTAPEAAFLVWQCRSVTLKEKIAAWREISRTISDCSMGERLNMDEMPSIHEFLEQYITLIERLLANFYCEEHAVYSYSGSYQDGSDFAEEYNRLYPDIVSCVAGFLNDEFVPFVPKAAHMIEDYLQTLAKRTCKSLPPYPVSLHTYHNFEIGSIRFKKRSLTSPGESITLILNDRLEPVEIDAFGQFLTKEEENLLLTFQGMWFAFPTPFKRGDIVFPCAKSSHIFYFQHGNAAGNQPLPPDGLFVLDSLPTWGSEEMRQNGFAPDGGKVKNSDRWLRNLTKNGDTSDLSFSAYYICNKRIIKEHIGNYLLLERYDGPLFGQHRLLGAVSGLLTGKIEPDTFFDLFQAIQAEEQWKDTTALREELCLLPETARLFHPTFEKHPFARDPQQPEK